MQESRDLQGDTAQPKGKTRLDVLLVQRGLAESREQAQRLILAGAVSVEGIGNLKPGLKVPSDARVTVVAGERYVSRGGLKLEAALVGFQIGVEGRVCADVGASTGGFTDCLLQRGAQLVYAVDVGASRLHERLRRDPRVVIVDHTNAREIHRLELPEKPTLAAVDLSFISIRKVLDSIWQWLEAGAEVVALVKPQFEATRAEASRGKGIIRDPKIHGRILREVLDYAQTHGWEVRGLMLSPIHGGSGNREYLCWLVRGNEFGAPQAVGIDIDAVVEQAFNTTSES